MISPNRLTAKPLSGHFTDRTTPVFGPVCSCYNAQNGSDCETFGSRARGQSLHQGISPNAISPLDAGRGNVALVAMDRIAPGTEEPTLVQPSEPLLINTRASSAAEEISDSWRRCVVDYRIDPRSRTVPNIITQGKLKVSSEPLADVILHAREEIDRLCAIVRQQAYVVLLCNDDGVAIHHRGDEARAEEFKRTSTC